MIFSVIILPSEIRCFISSIDIISGDAPSLPPLPAAQLTTSDKVAYFISSSRAKAASGMAVMPTMSQPSRYMRSISATVSRRGPWVTP